VVDTSAVGSKLAPGVVVMERQPISSFARAVKSTSKIYQDATVAKENGFDAIPAPPTWCFAASLFGAYPELQPEGAGKINPGLGVIRDLASKGGMILHGEQAFTYHRPILAGDTMSTDGEVKDISQKTSSSGSVMTFVSSETRWTNQRGELAVTAVMTLIHKS
jgi:acyl dehydratase